MKKLTFYYYSDSYINFNDLVNDLFKVWKCRVWLSAVTSKSLHPDRFGKNGQIQAPMPIAPGAVTQYSPSAQPSMNVGPGFGSTQMPGCKSPAPKDLFLRVRLLTPHRQLLRQCYSRPQRCEHASLWQHATQHECDPCYKRQFLYADVRDQPLLHAIPEHIHATQCAVGITNARQPALSESTWFCLHDPDCSVSCSIGTCLQSAADGNGTFSAGQQLSSSHQRVPATDRRVSRPEQPVHGPEQRQPVQSAAGLR